MSTTRRLSWLVMVAVFAALPAFTTLTTTTSAKAQDIWGRLHVRTGVSSALMMSPSQRTWLDYRAPGFLADFQLAYSAVPWLDVQLGATGGVFLSSAPGGLISPMVGVLGRLPLQSSFTPYALIDIGAGLTGALLRPFARAGIGVDFDLTPSFRFGPVLGLAVVTQHSGTGYSSDARYAWLGVSCTYWPRSAPAPMRQSIAAPPPRRLRTTPLPVMDAEPVADSPAEPPAPPSAELSALLDRALPSQQNELLAPVLFDFDSDVLQASGIAMLHEVARVLVGERADIQQLEIAAYSDARGTSEYNQALAKRRGERVRAWLVDHGVAPQRLLVKAEGAVDFVEPGDEEANHEQNRRVVFRIVQVKQP